MIEVRCDQTGDTAYAASERAAVAAAIQLCDDAHARQGVKPTATFLDDDGAVVRARVARATLWAAAGAYKRAPHAA